MSFITNIKRDIKDKMSQRTVERAKEIYQIKEKNGELWLTFNGYSVIPASMLRDDIITSLETLRNLFINTINNREL